MKRHLFVDTSAWCALADSADPEQPAVVACMREHRDRLVTSSYVFDETVTHLRDRIGLRAAQALGRQLLGGGVAQCVHVTADDVQAAWAIFQGFREEAPSFTDCTSFAVMQRLKLDTAITLDADFRSFGLNCLP